MKTTKHSFIAASAVLALVGLTGAVAQTGLITFQGPQSGGGYVSDGGNTLTTITTEGDYNASLNHLANFGGGNNIPGLTMTGTFGIQARRSGDGNGTFGANTASLSTLNNDVQTLTFNMDLLVSSFYTKEAAFGTSPVLQGLDANNTVQWTVIPSPGGWTLHTLSPTDAAKSIRTIRGDDVRYFGLDDISATPVPPSPPSLPFEIVEITQSEDSVTIRFNSVPGHIYSVEASDNLTDWDQIDDNVVGQAASETTEFTESPLPGGARRRYYRVLD